MSEPIINKRCSRCKQIKPISEFYKHIRYGLQSCCIICKRAYQRTEKGKVAHHKANKKYRRSDKGKAIEKRYAQDEKRKAAHLKSVEKYHKTEKGKVVQRAALKRFHACHPNHIKAKQTVNNAIRAGKLPRPDTLLCHYCPKPAQQYHHWRGYEPECWLDVVPVCNYCHVKERKRVG